MAHYAEGKDPQPFDAGAADGNCDGTIDAAKDAQLIAGIRSRPRVMVGA